MWGQRMIHDHERIRIRFAHDSYDTTMGDFTWLVKVVVQSALPNGYRIAGISSSQSSESQYYWVLSGNHCYSFRISSHKPLNGLPTHKQVQFVLRQYEDFTDLKQALVQYFSVDKRHLKLEFQHFLLLAYIHQIQHQNQTVFLKRNTLTVYTSVQREGIRIALSKALHLRLRQLIRGGMIVDGEDPHYQQRVGLTVTAGGAYVLKQYDQVMVSLHPEQIAVPLLTLNTTELQRRLLHPEMPIFGKLITPLHECALLVHVIDRLKGQVWFDGQFLQYQDQDKTYSQWHSSVTTLLVTAMELGLVRWNQDSQLVVSADGQRFLQSFQQNYAALAVYTALPKFRVPFEQLAIPDLVTAIADSKKLALLQQHYLEIGLKELRRQFYNPKQTIAQMCAHYLRKQRLKLYDGHPELRRELIAILYGKYRDDMLLRRDNEGNIVWDGYQIYGAAIKRALAHTQSGQQLFETQLKATSWRTDQRKVLKFVLRK